MNVVPPVLNSIELCAGVGMLALGVECGLEALGFGVRPVAYVEREAFACTILGDRGEQEALGAAPLYPSLAEFDGRPFRGLVDLIVAGLPCQPYSVAGKRQGNTDRRSFGEGDGPISHFLRIVEEVEPALVFLENVPAWVAARHQWFRPVGERLSGMGYRIEKPLFLAARDVGANHERERVFILAHREGTGLGILRHASGLEGRRQPDGDAEVLADPGRSLERKDQSLTFGGGGNAADDCARGKELADASDGQLQESRRGQEGRNGLGPAEPPVVHTESVDGRRELEACGARCGRSGSSGAVEVVALTSRTGLERRKQPSAPEQDGRTDGRKSHADQLPNFVMLNFSHPDQQTDGGEKSSPSIQGSRPRLNPAFGCWLMGLAPLWTNPGVISSEQLEMAQYRSLLFSHLSSLLARLD